MDRIDKINYYLDIAETVTKEVLALEEILEQL